MPPICDQQEWHQTVFPLLEETLLICGLGRKLGIVCFHPAYNTPSPAFLARHRFGHMHGLPTLRRYKHTGYPLQLDFSFTVANGNNVQVA